MAEINGGDTTDLTSANSGSKAEEGNSEEFNGGLIPVFNRLSIRRKPYSKHGADSELDEDLIYMQVFQLSDPSRNNDAEQKFKTYVDTMLNKLGVVFWKATLYRSYFEGRGAETTFTLNLHLFCREYLDDRCEQHILQERTKFTEQFNGSMSHLDTAVTVEKGSNLRKPAYVPQEAPDGPPDKRNCCEKFIDFWLIVPRVQWDFFDLIYQMYTFDITHQGFIPKFVHFFTIPINIILFFVFLAQFSFWPSLTDSFVYASEFVFDVNYAAVALAILVSAYILMGFLRNSPVWGITTAFCLVLCYLIANALYSHWRYSPPYLDDPLYNGTRRPWYNPVRTPYNPILWSYVTSLIQAGSHMFVPQLPPYITGVNHWEAISVFLFRKGGRACCYRILSFALFPILSVSVAYFSWPHLIGTEVFYIMAGIGYRHKYFKKYKLVTLKAELTGDPKLSRYPKTAEELMQNPPQHLTDKLHNLGLVDKTKATPRQITRELASLHIYQHYFSKNDNIHVDEEKYHEHVYHHQAIKDTHRFSEWRKERSNRRIQN